ncbi:DUF5777 family beta-barrel protein [Sunxiuqinia sp. sy24]|uniref:DUF5777 family beta-barrel protein n=1 Tax=Sunxiuqinia sp. sy24 TaxID=3461495 RepID=UPI00404608CC
MKRLFTLLLSFSLIILAQGQDLAQLFPNSDKDQASLPVLGTFNSSRIINAQSNETVHKNDLLFVVMHRFGDIAGSSGGIQTFYGLDNSTDILIGFDYGISDRWSIGIGRAKGSPNSISTGQRELVYLNSKFRIVRQSTDNRIPLSVSFFGNSVISTMEKSTIATSDAAFHSLGDRMSYLAQLIVTRKFNYGLSLAILPTYIRRNYVSYMDENNLFALGLGTRVKISPGIAIIADYFIPFRGQNSKDYFLEQKDFQFHHPLGLGLEIETGGHVFNAIFTNSAAILENQFIPATSSSWGSGEFRWGFTITRTFSLAKNEP